VPSDGDGDGTPPEEISCAALRWIAVFLIALGLFLFVAWLCVSTSLGSVASAVFLGIAIGVFAAGIIVLFIWIVICPVKPCQWGWLIGGQIMLGFGLACLMLSGPSTGLPCCAWMLAVGAIAAGLGALFFSIWIFRCAPSFCQIVIELAPVVANALSVIGIIAAVPVLSNCVHGPIRGVVGIVSGILVGILAGCAAAGTTTKTGPPVN
jgi:hypothetical protein